MLVIILILKILYRETPQQNNKPSVFSIFQEAPNLPKTRSGKIMRRVLRKIAKDDEDLGDTSTLVDPGVIAILQEGHRKLVNK